MLENLIQSARARGYVTSREVLDLYPDVESSIPQIDELFAKLIDEGVTIVMNDGRSNGDPSNAIDFLESVAQMGTESMEETDLDSDEEPDTEELEQEEEDVTATTANLDGIAADDTVSLYLKQMGQVPLLTAAEEVLLARQIEEGNFARARLNNNKCMAAEERINLLKAVKAGDMARTKLVEANTRLVVSVAKKYLGQGVPLLDLIQEGNIGLMKAVEKFDYHRGYKFSTYATWWIRQVLRAPWPSRAD